MSQSASQPLAVAQAAGARLVEQCDIPADMTIGEWREARAAAYRASRPRRTGLFARLRVAFGRA